MAAGSQLKTFQTNLDTTGADMREILGDAQTLSRAFSDAATASKNYLEFRKILKNADGVISAQVTILKLSQNIAPLSTPSKALLNVLEVIQPKVVKLRDVTDKGKKLEPLLQKIVDADKINKAEVLPVLISTDQTLERIDAGIDEIVTAFDMVSTPNGIPEINPEAGIERPGKAAFVPLFGEVDSFLAPVNTLNGPASAATDAYIDTKAFFSDILSDFNIADFSLLNEIFGDIFEFDGLVAFLDGITGTVEAALRPVEPLLDAIGLVFDTFVSPVIDFVVDAVGADEIFDELAKILDPLLPELTLFDDYERIAESLEALIDSFSVNFFDVPDFTTAALDAFDRFTQVFDTAELAALALLDGIPVRIGEEAPRDDQNTSVPSGDDDMFGTGGDEVFDPRSGDDRVLANTGNDIIVASAGNDTIDGGGGTDRISFAGNLGEYQFSRLEKANDNDPNVFVFTHTRVGGHGFNEGTETVTGVEFFDFDGETFTEEDFANAVVGRSVIDREGSGPDGARSTDNDELIFLNPGGTLVSGLTLNGQTFNNMNVVYGLGGDDRIQTTRGPDFIFAGPGNDLIVPLEGDDAIDGGPGSDTVQLYDFGRNLDDDLDLRDGKFFSSEGDLELSSVENAVILYGGALSMFGSDGGNVLMSADGRDFLSGRGGNDALIAGEGRDVLVGGNGVDTLRGGDGNDLLITHQFDNSGASELYDGEAGFDTLSYESSDDQIKEKVDSRIIPGELAKFRNDDLGSTGPIIVRAAQGEVHRLDAEGNILATDFARSIEAFIGSDSDDTIYGFTLPGQTTRIEGGQGNDVLYTWGTSNVDGGLGDDLIIAERGPSGGSVAGNISSKGGFDTLDISGFETSRIVVTSSAGSSQRAKATIAEDFDEDNPFGARGSSFNISGIDEILLGVNDDHVTWGTGTDVVIRAGAGNDFLRSFNSSSTQAPQFHGEAGDDQIFVEDGGNAFGGDGSDFIRFATSGSDLRAEGGAGNDFISLTRMTGIVDGGEGYDRLLFDPDGGASVTVNLGGGRATSTDGDIDIVEIIGIEEVFGSARNDNITGSENDDRLYMGDGNDAGFGRGGNDQMFGGAGNDRLEGGSGNDTLNGGTGTNQLVGGDGTDTADFAVAVYDGGESGSLEFVSTSSVQVNLANGTAVFNGATSSLDGIESAIGTRFNDRLTGDGGDNVLNGRGGTDTLEGGGGNDVLIAGTVASGRDEMSGGAGDDRFILGNGNFFANGDDGVDLLDFSGSTDINEGGGRTLSLQIDLAARSVDRVVEVGRPVWAEADLSGQGAGSTSVRVFDGQDVTPTMVLATQALYARTFSDLDLRLPTGLEEQDVDSLAVEIAVSEQQRTERDAFEGIEGATGSAGGDTMRGDGGANRFEGGGGDDRFEGRGGDDDLDGGEGARDIAEFSGAFDDYRIELRNGMQLVTDKTGADGTDMVRNVELLRFSDGFSFSDNPENQGFVDVDNLSGVATLDEAALRYFVEMYIAYFDRSPDSLGLFYWGDRLSEGMTMPEIAASFFVQPESQAAYPNADDNEFLVDTAYRNLLEREAEPEGRAFWINALNTGDVSRPEFMLAIINGAKAETGSPEDARVIAQKADLGIAYAVIEGLNDLDNARSAMEEYDRADAEASLARADALIDVYASEAASLESTETVVALAGVVADPFEL